MQEIEINIKPYDNWPAKKTPENRKRSSFKAGLIATRAKLNTEIRKLGGNSMIVQINVRPEDIRNDGHLRSTARPLYEGVIVTFESKHGSLTYKSDAFRDWQSNLRAVAITLERLRLAELYGCAESGEQYRGFAQLPMGDFTEAAAPFKTADEAFLWLAEITGTRADLFKTVPGVWKFAYREAAKKLHPDRGGQTEDFQKLQYADKLVQESLPK